MDDARTKRVVDAPSASNPTTKGNLLIRQLSAKYPNSAVFDLNKLLVRLKRVDENPRDPRRSIPPYTANKIETHDCAVIDI
jgi:hypothetical protein